MKPLLLLLTMLLVAIGSCRVNDLNLRLQYTTDDSEIQLTNHESAYLQNLKIEINHEYVLHLKNQLIAPGQELALSTDLFMNSAGRVFDFRVHKLQRIWIQGLVGNKGQTPDYRSVLFIIKN